MLIKASEIFVLLLNIGIVLISATPPLATSIVANSRVPSEPKSTTSSLFITLTP